MSVATDPHRYTLTETGRTRDWITVKVEGRKRQGWAQKQAETMLEQGETLSSLIKIHPYYIYCVRQPSVDRH